MLRAEREQIIRRGDLQQRGSGVLEHVLIGAVATAFVANGVHGGRHHTRRQPVEAGAHRERAKVCTGTRRWWFYLGGGRRRWLSPLPATSGISQVGGARLRLFLLLRPGRDSSAGGGAPLSRGRLLPPFRARGGYECAALPRSSGSGVSFLLHLAWCPPFARRARGRSWRERRVRSRGSPVFGCGFCCCARCVQGGGDVREDAGPTRGLVRGHDLRGEPEPAVSKDAALCAGPPVEDVARAASRSRGRLGTRLRHEADALEQVCDVVQPPQQVASCLVGAARQLLRTVGE
mmetsp:Transcript_12688/g.53374  ORF Transcript_12688/g.53374 Transcript_12688/m.53374 type:complete len:290 (-) Transcript_12688:1422-2291(-)